MIVGEDFNSNEEKAVRAFVKGDLSPPKPSRRKATKVGWKKRTVHPRGKKCPLQLIKENNQPKRRKFR
jgi:hypothetical protein